jgi:hypothetical protein
MLYGEVVSIDNFKISIYPQWLTPGEDLEAWQKWAGIEKKFDEEVQKNRWDYQKGLGDLRRAIQARSK